ncbi:MAG: hypothetical protein Q9207_006726 [Kuettlingeria erythrocarpa]
MEHVPIANLEAELGCLDTPLLNAGPKYDHEDPHNPFEAPAGSASCLNPPSKTESFFSFGADGTVAWTTAAGELLQVASCMDNRLVGAMYKKDIQKGTDYYERGKMLERAISAPQGSGYGIGLSLGHSLKPLEKSWVHNRWPKFTYRHGTLDICLQYFVDSSTVIQEYRIRNAGHEEVVVRNDEEQCQMTMALFLNAQRQSLWVAGGDTDKDVKNTKLLTSSLHPTEGLIQTDERLRRWILSGELVDEDADWDFKKSYQRCHERGEGIWRSHDALNFASHNAVVVVPPESTQKLRAVIHISALSESKQPDPHLASVSENNNPKDGQRSGDSQVESQKENLRHQQSILVDKAKHLSLKNPSQGAKPQICQLIADHIDVGKACTVLHLIGEARYHMFTACLIAEYVYKEDPYDFHNARFVYGKFLHRNGWLATAVKNMEHLLEALSKQKLKAKRFTILRKKVQIWLATMYVDTDDFFSAEKLYENVLPYPIGDETILDPVSARCLERLAWAQVKQQKFKEAHKSYSFLLKLPKNQRRIILSDLGFIELKLGDAQHAKLTLEETLRLCDSTTSSVEQLFQFKFLTQSQMYINAGLAESTIYSETSESIKHACRAHLLWIFQIVELHETWDKFYPPRGTWLGPKTPSDVRSLSQVLEGAFNFSKIWLYLNTWTQDWAFALEQLHFRLEEWLTYLRDTQHMSNLWVENSGYDNLRAYDSVSADAYSFDQQNPEYHLSDFTMLWLALKRIEELIDSIERSCSMDGTHEDDPVKRKVDEVRKIFDYHQSTLPIETIRLNILKTFTISEREESAFHTNTHQKTVITRENASIKPQSPTQVGNSDWSPYVDDSTAERVTAFQEFHESKPAPQVIAFARSVSEFVYNIRHTDIATIEAASVGFFDVAKDHTTSAWQETLKMQLDNHVTGYNNPRLIALTLYAAKFKIVLNDVQHHGRRVTGLQLPSNSQPSGLSPEKRKPILMPQQVGTSQRFARKNVVADALFQPTWMYFPHIYLHRYPLEIEHDERFFKILESMPGLKRAFANWNQSKEFSTARTPRIFPPHVADSGTKKGVVFDGKPLQRQTDIQWYGNAAAFYDRLIQPRTFDSAKKRLVELTSFHQDLSLLCLLTSPKEQKVQFALFLLRHSSSESLFGERVEWKGNVWETELHLGFYQLISKEDNKTYPPATLDYQGQFRVREMPTLSQASATWEITPVTTSLRFVGDLRDQAWTCHFLTSVARDFGFTGLVNEYTDGDGEATDTAFHKEKMAQRKILEMAYVDRMLTEIVRSCEGILQRFQNELKIPETRNPESESYEFIHDYSRLHSKTGEILRDVLKLLDLSLRTMEHWEKREASRDIRSRWSQKDETRYGSKLVDLARKCKIGMQQVRVQRDLLEEQQKLAEQRHSNLINYMSLQNARTSSQSAEDVRLFTYVTIFFVPLSFSSSLFSMGGAPKGSTLSVMIPTTVIASAVTVLALANMKMLDRNLSFWTNKFNASARKNMGTSESSWGFQWKKIAEELEEAAELRLAKPEDEKHLPAQSRWWYILFWISYALASPRVYMFEGFRIWGDRSEHQTNAIVAFIRVSMSISLVPACAFIFTVQLLTISASDLLGLVWQMMRWLKAIYWDRSHIRVEELHEEDVSRNGGKPREGGRRIISNKSLDEHARSSSNLGTFEKWLQFPPRPLHRTINKLKPSTSAADNAGPKISGSGTEVELLVHSDEIGNEEDEWEMFVEKGVIARVGTLASQAQPGMLEQRQTSDGPYQKRFSWRTRVTDGEAPGSGV